MAKSYKPDTKKIILNEIMGKQGVYRPFCVKIDKKECIFDYNLNEYYQLLIKAAKSSNAVKATDFCPITDGVACP